MLGNNLRKIGSNNSMNGTMMKTANGTSLKIEVVVLVSCYLFVHEIFFPLASFNKILKDIVRSAQRSLVPIQ